MKNANKKKKNDDISQFMSMAHMLSIDNIEHLQAANADLFAGMNKKMASVVAIGAGAVRETLSRDRATRIPKPSGVPKTPSSDNQKQNDNDINNKETRKASLNSKTTPIENINETNGTDKKPIATATPEKSGGFFDRAVKGLKLVGKRIPVVGAAVTAGFVAVEVGDHLLDGNFKLAAGSLTAGAAETAGNILGFGAGDLAREATRSTIIATGGEEFSNIAKSDVRIIGEEILGKKPQTNVVSQTKNNHLTNINDFGDNAEFDPNLDEPRNVIGSYAENYGLSKEPEQKIEGLRSGFESLSADFSSASNDPVIPDNDIKQSLTNRPSLQLAV